MVSHPRAGARPGRPEAPSAPAGWGAGQHQLEAISFSLSALALFRGFLIRVVFSQVSRSYYL